MFYHTFGISVSVVKGLRGSRWAKPGSLSSEDKDRTILMKTQNGIPYTKMFSKWNKSGVVHATTFKYSLYMFSKTIPNQIL